MIIVRIRAAARSCKPIRLSLGDLRPFGVSDFCCTRASLLQLTLAVSSALTCPKYRRISLKTMAQRANCMQHAKTGLRCREEQRMILHDARDLAPFETE
ncbi:hypothetical protein [Bradyrhizobium monzae]|uniref:hypothetical protein n=1 Tax=Bradyrhizobium sp. Oc8 TaxID=2876780 RepID=UPI001F1B25BD|nr:hypothetical protein [Bradyrhizobium sp. Oc8]